MCLIKQPIVACHLDCFSKLPPPHGKNRLTPLIELPLQVNYGFMFARAYIEGLAKAKL